jgi:hypothetical protein
MGWCKEFVCCSKTFDWEAKMMSGKVFLCALILAGSVSAQGQGPAGGGSGLMRPRFRILGAEAGRPGPVVTGAPYSADAVTEVTQTLADGNQIHQVTTTRIYRDSQGRTRREPTLNALGSDAAGTGQPQIAFISDPVAGMNYALDLAQHTATSSVFRQRAAGPGRAKRLARRAADSANIKTESLGRQLIAGVPADGTRVTVTIPAGQIGNAQPIQIVSERWYSPDLELTVLSKRSDPRTGEIVSQLTNLSRAEPPATLFEVPADYQITPQPPGVRFRSRNRATQ